MKEMFLPQQKGNSYLQMKNQQNSQQTLKNAQIFKSFFLRTRKRSRVVPKRYGERR